jgi:hypothetical protein
LGKLIQKDEKETMNDLPSIFQILGQGNEVDIGKKTKFQWF